MAEQLFQVLKPNYGFVSALIILFELRVLGFLRHCLLPKWGVPGMMPQTLFPK